MTATVHALPGADNNVQLLAARYCEALQRPEAQALLAELESLLTEWRVAKAAVNVANGAR